MGELALIVNYEQLSLEELANHANIQHKAADESAKTAFAHRIAAGEALIAAKGRLKHGEWLPWLELNFLGDERTAQLYMKAANAKDLSDLHFSSDRLDWETPQDLFDDLDAEFGFTLDVCATDMTAKCERYFTPADDGLAQEWEGVCWMNPPYGKEIVRWVEKAANCGATVVCLVPARVDTAWWWDHCRHGDVRFLKGRLRFDGASAGAPFPSAVVVFPGSGSTTYWER
jgi:phage N-6-adenine-methyltransferase